MSKITKEACDLLAAEIVRRKLFATPEEVAAWRQTESGKRLCARLDKGKEKHHG